MTNSLTEEEEALRRRMYAEGLSDHEAGRLLGISNVSFLLWRHRRGLPARRRRPVRESGGAVTVSDGVSSAEQSNQPDTVHGRHAAANPGRRRARGRRDPFCECGNLIVPGKAHRHATPEGA